jgi:hypothetical protein
LECFDKMGDGLELRRECFGLRSNEYNKMAEMLCDACNQIGVQFMNRSSQPTTGL